ncbi:hypothetical protein GUJ93_ZPchr0002g23826 [Zizania palustris]|uniref:Uncharacterized protein n=1 Tax=Zizania palustris TaxID=103762 RepID=A0A8J5RZH7_ZIZPA|nr:hypothetical protein GUJ93_ZPchr0002g23826 [Zizania palustris]
MEAALAEPDLDGARTGRRRHGAPGPTSTGRQRGAVEVGPHGVAVTDNSNSTVYPVKREHQEYCNFLFQTVLPSNRFVVRVRDPRRWYIRH